MSVHKLLPAKGDDAQAKRERRKEARPGELLDAALDLFVEKGFAATRAEEVAARAGVSKGTLFLYFPSKEELFKAVVRHNISGHVGAWGDELDAYPGSASDRLRFFMQAWWDRVGTTRASGLTKLMMSEAQNFPELAAFYHHEVILPVQALIRRMLQLGVERGEFEVPDPEYAVMAVTAPMIFLIMNKHAMGACVPCGMPIDPARYIAAQSHTLLAGFCVRPAGKAGRAR